MKQHEGLFTQLKKFNAKNYRKENTSMYMFFLRLAIVKQFQMKYKQLLNTH